MEKKVGALWPFVRDWMASRGQSEDAGSNLARHRFEAAPVPVRGQG